MSVCLSVGMNITKSGYLILRSSIILSILVLLYDKVLSWRKIQKFFNSIGSAFSGSLLSKYRWSPKSVLVLFSSLRIFALTLQTGIISTWGKEAVDLEALDQFASTDFVLFYVSVLRYLCFRYCQFVNWSGELRKSVMAQQSFWCLRDWDPL